MNFRPDNELAMSVIHIISLSFIMSVLIVNLTRGSRKARELRKRQMNVQWTSAEARDPRFLGGVVCRYITLKSGDMTKKTQSSFADDV